MKKLKVAVIGLGYVGLPLACLIANNPKYHISGFDLSKEKINLINNGESPIDDKIANQLINKLINCVSSDEKILRNSDIFIICVPTPIDDDYEPDYKPLIDASKIVTKYLIKGNIIVIESTVNPGACEEVVLPILEKSGLCGGKDFELAHCPERINPGDPKWNVYNISRNIGALTKKGCRRAAEFYRSFINAEISELDNIKEAEATKIIENAFRDINIAYVNELAMSFDAMGIDLHNVIKGASNKPFAFLAHYPGCGVGGHCIAVDPYYLIKRAGKADFDHQFLKNARRVNNHMPRYTIERLIKGLNKVSKSVKNTRIALLGLSYKNNVGDIRESPALKIIKILENEYHATLNIFDPYFPKKCTYKKLGTTLKNSDAVLITTGHKEFIETDLLKYKNIKVIIDGRNCLDKNKYKDKLVYFGIGR